MKYAFKTVFFCWLAAALLVWAAVEIGLPLDNILSEGREPAPENAVLAVILLMLAMFAFTAPFMMLMLHMFFGIIFKLAVLPGHSKRVILEQQITALEQQLEKERLSYKDYRDIDALEKSITEKRAALEKLRGTSSESS